MARRMTRISPAHAGNTIVMKTLPKMAWDQPRTCGEYAAASRGFRPDRGSAPHMRGILKLAGLTSESGGISPAHAGNTDSSWPLVWSAADQPRTCGEYGHPPGRGRRGWGSAPHMRGIQHSGQVVVLGGGISPAHAGNTAHVLFHVQRTWDQPRTCGEYPVKPPPRPTASGSAPHMRGIPAMLIILACGVEDQPRTCGEYGDGPGAELRPDGSAPHMRGIPRMMARRAWGYRISPAHAGNTRGPASPSRRSWDQPRTCGEYPTHNLSA